MAKPRPSRMSTRRLPSSTLLLTMLLMFTFVILILLALRILSIPSNSGDSSKANYLNSIVRRNADSTEGDEGKVEQWVEVISWEPRAFVYHNFLGAHKLWDILN